MTDIKTQAKLNLLAAQRNQGLDGLVECAAELAEVRAKLSELEAKWDDPKALTERLAKLDKPVKASK